MTHTTTTDPPVFRPTTRSRWRWITTPYRKVRLWYIRQPRGIRYGLVVLVVSTLAAGAIYGWSYKSRRAADRAAGAAWAEYGAAVRKLDMDGINAALDNVLAAKPGDPIATRYKDILARGESDAEIPELALVLMHQYIRTDKLTEAAREAEKVLTHNPKDWQARCVLAHHALQMKNDRALAEQHLSKLPDPEDPAAGIGPGGILYALRLSDAIGRDAIHVRRLIVSRLVPVMRGGVAATAPPIAKAQLIECYLEPFSDPSSLTSLSDYWVSADQLAESAVTEAVAAGEVPVLARLAMLGPRMRIALRTLREHDPVRLPEDRFNHLTKAIDDRTRKAWLKVRELAPDRVDAYRGLALLALLENNPRGALAQVLDGLSACGDRPELLDLLIPLEASFGSDENLEKIYHSLVTSAQQAKTDPSKWCHAANTAIALNRHDLALACCQNALAIQPNHPAACQTAAWLLVRHGEPVNFQAASNILLAVGEAALRTNPVSARLHGRLMVETGLGKILDDEFKKIVEAQAALKPKTTAPSVGFLLGVFDAEPDLKRAEWVAAHAAQLLASEPDAPSARRIRAVALFRAVDLTAEANPKGGSPLMNGERVAAAMRAFEDLPPEERTEAGVAAAIALLQLKGQGNAVTALRTAGALIAVEGSLNSGQLEALGVVLAANGKTTEAIRVMERAARMPRPSAGLWIALALAYHKNKQPIDSQAALARAHDTPNRSTREQLELVAAKQHLAKDN